MNVLIPWSGGLDSTYLVCKALEDGDTVYYYHAECGQSHNAYMAEEFAIKAIKSTLSSEHQDRLIRLRLNVKLDFRDAGFCFSQMPAWLLYSLTMVSTYTQKEFTEVRLGYLMGDDAIGSIHKLKNIWDCLTDLLVLNASVKTELKFPLDIIRKESIIDLSRNKEWFKHIWWCELPQSDGVHYYECGECPSCYKHQQSLIPVHRKLNSRFHQLNLTTNIDHNHKRRMTMTLLTPNQLARMNRIHALYKDEQPRDVNEPSNYGELNTIFIPIDVLVSNGVVGESFALEHAGTLTMHVADIRQPGTYTANFIVLNGDYHITVNMDMQLLLKLIQDTVEGSSVVGADVVSESKENLTSDTTGPYDDIIEVTEIPALAAPSYVGESQSTP